MPLPSKPFASRVARPWALAMALGGLAATGQAQVQAPRNVVSLSATASQDINQDLLVVTLNVMR
ncbi:MAG: hypothetical protein RJB60_369, partial [Pseudomonadota bacterium]